MIQLNLLPWRQHDREVKKSRFFLGGIIATVIVLLILGVVHHAVANKFNYQQSRNDFIQSEINKEQAVLANLKKEMNIHLSYEEKIRSIINVKKTSFNAIRLLNALPVLSTPSISIIEISRVGNLIIIKGKAQSNSQITLFMDSIANQSTIFNAPNLTVITNEKNTSRDAGYFELKIIEKDIV